MEKMTRVAFRKVSLSARRKWIKSQLWWLIPVIQALRRLRQGYCHEIHISLGYSLNINNKKALVVWKMTIASQEAVDQVEEIQSALTYRN